VTTRHIVLVGLMGSGKTSIGTRVAQRLSLPFIDSDAELERRTGHTAREILATEGAERLHAQEGDVVMGALSDQALTVIGAPASIVDTPGMRDRIREEYVVWLHADPHWLEEKVAESNNDSRPFVDRDPGVLVQQHEARKDLFREVASLIVESTRRDKDEIAAEIVAAVERDGLTTPAGPAAAS
jgi:shikimate kinase